MNQLTPVDDKPKRQLIDVVDPIPVLDTSRFEHMQRIASVMAQSTLIPESLYKEKDKDLPLAQIISNCFLVVNQSVRWGLDPFAVAQSVAVVRGKLCYEGKLVAAVLDAKLSVRLYATFTGDPTKPDYRIYLSDIPWTAELIAQLRPGFTAPGMRVVDGSVADWQSGEKGAWGAVKNYRRMLIYRGTRDWARFYEPAVLLGVYTPDEMLDLADNARAERAREFAERPSLAERLQMAQIEQHTAAQPREGFDPDFAAGEADSLSDAAQSEHEQLSAAPSADSLGSGEDSPQSTAPDPSTSEPNSDDETGEPEQEAAGGQSAACSPVDPTWIKTFAKVVAASIGPDEGDVVTVAKSLFREDLTEEQRAKAKSITKYARAASRNEMERSDTLDVIAGVAGIDVRELA